MYNFIYTKFYQTQNYRNRSATASGQVWGYGLRRGLREPSGVIVCTLTTVVADGCVHLSQLIRRHPDCVLPHTLKPR